MMTSLLILALTQPTLSQDTSPTNTTRKPNFIIIFTDDQGYNDLGCFGSPDIKTPHIDDMAKNGIKFSNFYAQPICGPSRAALMTGSYPLRIAEVGNIKRVHPMVHPKEIMLPKLLKTAGYTTGCIGKWDLNGHSPRFKRKDIYPDNFGFDYWYGTGTSNDSGKIDLWLNRKIIERNVGMNNVVQKYNHAAVSFIKKHQNKPFFLYLAHTMPHTKLGASKQFKGKSSRGLYGDVIEEIDWSTGQIINTLKQLNLDKQTLVIFTSDNGPWLVRGKHGGSAHPLRGCKLTTWEGGPRVPCVMWAPGLIKSGLVCHEITSTMDILPTACQLTGAPLPKDRIIDGQNILPLMKGDIAQFNEERIYYYYFLTHLQAVRKGPWKLVLKRPRSPQWLGQLSKASSLRKNDVMEIESHQLYNLSKDTGETTDLAKDNPQKVQELLQIAAHARQDIGDYNCIGKNARFFDTSPPRPSIKKWIAK